MTLTRILSVCVVVLSACQLSSPPARDAAPAPRDLPFEPSPALVPRYPTAEAENTAIACGATGNSSGKLWGLLEHELQIGATHVGVIIDFSRDVTDRDVEALGPQVERIDDRTAFGHHLSLAELARVCQDPRVTTVREMVKFDVPRVPLSRALGR